LREFFQVWRRKAALATLLMALLLAVTWMRSGIVRDVIVISFEESWHTIESSNGGICWKQWKGNLLPSMQWESGEASMSDTDWWVDLDVEWRQEWAGFHFGAGTSTLMISSDSIPLLLHFGLWIIPYWSLVLPLTLLSAWLLLIKPRGVKSMKEPKVA
jgi:hypothetical protein